MRASKQSRGTKAGARAGPQPWKLTLFGWTLGLWITTTFLLAQQCLSLHPLRALERLTEDLRQAILPAAAPAHPDIVVVAITETSFAHLGRRFPVDRAFLAALLRSLAPARAIGIDLFLGEETTPEADAALIAAIRDSPVPLTIGHLSAGLSGGSIPLWQERTWAQFIQRLGPDTGWHPGTAVFPVDTADGVVRSYFFGPIETEPAGFATVIARSIGVETAPSGIERIAFRGNAWSAPFSLLPAEAFLSPIPAVRAAMRDLVQDRIALIGVVLPVEERHRTALSRFGPDLAGTPGILVHAHALAQILAGTRIDQAGPIPFALGNAGLALLGLVLALAPFALLGRIVLLWVTLAGWLAVTCLAFLAGNLLLPVVPSLLALVLGYGGTEALRIMRTNRLSRFDTYLLSGFLGPQVLDAVRAEPRILGREGQVRDVTVLITDLEGSLGLIDHEDPSTTVTLIKSYFEGMAEVVLEHGGTLDKFTGDGLLAFFGAPQERPDDPQRAVLCALALLAAANRFRERVSAGGRPFGRTRIGLHAARSVVGNVGGARRFDYTVLGLAPSLAARLENANKRLGTSILMSGTVADRCGPEIERRPLGSIRVRGAPGPLRLWEPLAPAQRALATASAEALAAVEAGRSDRLERVAEAAARFPDDPFLQRLHARVEREGCTGPLLWDLTAAPPAAHTPPQPASTSDPNDPQRRP